MKCQKQYLKIRFNLGAGQNYRKWQIRSPSDIQYIDPAHAYISIYNAKLHNNRRIAEGIYKGKNKSTCAWIAAESATIHEGPPPIAPGHIKMPLFYNPKISPFWRDSYGQDIDNLFFSLIIICGKNIWSILDAR